MEIKLARITEDEKNIFLEKLSKFYPRELAYFRRMFEADSNEVETELFQINVARFSNGFAVLESDASIMMPGRFYIYQQGDFYRVCSNVTDHDDFDSGSYISLIQKNGFERVNDDGLEMVCEKIRQAF